MFYKKSVLKISQIHVKTPVLLKKRLWHKCFPLNFAKFLRTPFLQNTSERLLDLSQSYVTSSSALSCDTSVCNDSLDQTEFVKESPDAISCQDDQLLRILEDL